MGGGVWTFDNLICETCSPCCVHTRLISVIAGETFSSDCIYLFYFIQHLTSLGAPLSGIFTVKLIFKPRALGLDFQCTAEENNQRLNVSMGLLRHLNENELSLFSGRKLKS